MSNPREARRRRLRGRFLRALAEHGIVARAAREAGAARRLFYYWRDHDEDFAARWDEALALGLAALEDAAMERALDGAERTVWYHGKPVGAERRPSDTLMMFLLRNRLPDRYGWGPGGKAAIWARAEAGGRGNDREDAPPLRTYSPEERSQQICRLLTDLGLDVVPRPGDPENLSHLVIRDLVLAGAPGPLYPGPGRNESGP